MSAAHFCRKTGVRLKAPGVSKAVDPENGIETFDGTEPPAYDPNKEAANPRSTDAKMSGTHAPGGRVVTGNLDSQRAREREAAVAPNGDKERERPDGKVVRPDRSVEAGQAVGAQPPRTPEEKALDDERAKGPGPKTMSKGQQPGEDDPHGQANRERAAAAKGMPTQADKDAAEAAGIKQGATDSRDASMSHAKDPGGTQAMPDTRHADARGVDQRHSESPKKK